MSVDNLPMHKDTYFFSYGIDIEKPIEMANKIIKLQQENQQLKKQLSNSHQIKKQKEFIEYLESEMILFQEYMKEIECSDRCHGDYPITYWSSKCKLNEVAEILSKYKEIIGGKSEDIN